MVYRTTGEYLLGFKIINARNFLFGVLENMSI